MNTKQSVYMCIDLKSFYASVECADLGLDPFTTPLVVADASRGKGAITLAISPALKNMGVKNRSRLFQIPPHIEYLTVKPHMKRYMDVSASIYGVILHFVSPEDVHVYSIDEYFIDITSYLNLYNTRAIPLAETILAAILDKTGIYATAGIGTNLFLAKIALDILAKHAPNFIGWLDEPRFKQTIWHHQPITDIWQIGKGIAARLRKYGAFDLYGVTQIPEQKLYKEFGVNAELIIDHSWGRETCTIADIHAYRPSKHSISNGQILLRDYESEEARLPLREMVENLTLELLQIKAVTKRISLHIGYADESVRSSGGMKSLAEYTDSYQALVSAMLTYYDKVIKPDEPIRRLTIGFEELGMKNAVPREGNLFDFLENSFGNSIHANNNIYASNSNSIDISGTNGIGRGEGTANGVFPYGLSKEEHMQQAMLSIKERFGKNAILRAASLQEEGTARLRNSLVGGHNGE